MPRTLRLHSWIVRGVGGLRVTVQLPAAPPQNGGTEDLTAESTRRAGARRTSYADTPSRSDGALDAAPHADGMRGNEKPPFPAAS